MGIPGSKPKIEPFAKVRIGETRTSQRTGNDYPAATDYFRSDAPEFAELVGAKPKTIRIRLVHDAVDDAFSTGLEWWIKDKNKKSMLGCYTKDSGDNPVALRMDGLLNPGMVPLSPEPVGNNRLRIACAARECPQMKKGDCKPMGRLVFTLDGDQLSRVWELDTKAWSSIEAIDGVLRVAQTNASLAGRLFELSVRFERKGDDKFPVMSIREITAIDAQTGKAVAQAEANIAVEQTDGDLRAKVIAALEASGRDPRSPAVAEWVKEQGLEKALEKLTGQAL
jgi:hypothetical protein